MAAEYTLYATEGEQQAPTPPKKPQNPKINNSDLVERYACAIVTKPFGSNQSVSDLI